MGRRKPWTGYAVAVVATAVAVLARAAYDWWFGPEPVYLIPFLVPVAFAGWAGGLWCGLFATALNALIALYGFTEPVYSFAIVRPSDAVRFGVFVAVGIGLTLLNQELHRYRHRAEDHVRDSLARQAELEREVVDRRVAERQLVEERERVRDDERRLRLLLESLPQLVWTCTSDGSCDYLSRQWVEYTGVSETEQLGGGWAAAIHPDDRPRLLARWQQSVRDRAHFDIEYRIRAASGEYRWFKTRSILIATADGTDKWFGTCTDIHDTKQFEERLRSGASALEAQVAERTADLRASEERFRLAAAAAGVGVWEWNIHTNRIHWNAQMFQIYQVPLTPDGVVPYETWSGAVVPEDLPRQIEALQVTIDRLGSGTRSFRIRLPNGGCRYLEAAERVRLNSDGRAEWVVGTNLDVTDRVLAVDALRDERERFRAFMDNSPAVAYMKDEDGRAVYINEPMRQQFGTTGADWLGKTEYDRFPASVADAMRAHDRAVLAGGVPVRVTETVPAPDGSSRVWQVHKFPFTDAAGRRFLAGIAVDVTAEAKAEAAVRESEERFRCAFEYAPIGVSLTATDGRWLQVNRSLCQLTGYSEGELLASDFQAITHPDDLDKDLDQLQLFLDGAVQSYQTEKRYFHKQGHQVHVHLSVAMVRNDRGAPLYFICHIIDITARKSAEAALRASEDRFRNAFDSAPIGMGLVAPGGGWLQVNRRMCQIVGFAEAELLATDIHALTHPDDRGADLGLFDQVFAGTIPHYQTEKRYMHKDGHTVEVLVAVSLVRDAAGRPRHFIAQVKDISERRAAQRASAASEALLRQFITHSPAAVAMFDLEGRYLQVSDRWVADFHLGGRVLIGESHYDVFPDRTGRWRAVHRRVLTGAVEACDEDPFERADGTVEWLQWECRPWRAADGRIGGLIMFTQFVTGRRKAEEDLRKSEERLRMALRGARAGVWECSLPEWGSYWSPEYRDLYGFTADEEARVDKWRNRVHPDDLSRIEANLGAITVPGRDAWQQEFRLVIPGRGVRWILDFVRVIRAPDGRPTGIGGVNIDISDRKRAEEQIRASLTEKELLLKEIHHRVKNNLQIISALLYLQSAGVPDKAVRAMFEESRGRVKSMALIHERLYRSGDLAGVDLAEYVRQLAADLYRAYKVSHESVRLDLDVTVPPLPIDVAIPCGLLLNELVSNCLKHAFKGRPEGSIGVTFRRAAGDVVLSVSDDGVGLPPGFDFRTATSFGLQLIHTLAEQLNGHAAQAGGPGATIEVTFPAPKEVSQ